MSQTRKQRAASLKNLRKARAKLRKKGGRRKKGKRRGKKRARKGSTAKIRKLKALIRSL